MSYMFANGTDDFIIVWAKDKCIISCSQYLLFIEMVGKLF